MKSKVIERGRLKTCSLTGWRHMKIHNNLSKLKRLSFPKIYLDLKSKPEMLIECMNFQAIGKKDLAFWGIFLKDLLPRLGWPPENHWLLLPSTLDKNGLEGTLIVLYLSKSWLWVWILVSFSWCRAKTESNCCHVRTRRERFRQLVVVLGGSRCVLAKTTDLNWCTPLTKTNQIFFDYFFLNILVFFLFLFQFLNKINTLLFYL